MTQATIALKLRLSPTQEVANILDSQSRMCNWLYNHLLETSNHLKKDYHQNQGQEIAKTLYTKHGLRNLVPGIKEKHPFLKSVHSSPLKNVALRLTDSIQAYQKSRQGKRQGKSTGWPGFRSWQNKWFSLLYDEPNKGFKIKGNQLRLSLGQNQAGKRHYVEMQIQDPHVLHEKTIRNLRIVEQNGHYFAVITVEKHLPECKPMHKIIALDPNHKNLAYGVNNQGCAIEIESPWWLKKFDKRIDALKSKRDRCKKQSKRIILLDADGQPTGRMRYVPSRRYRQFNHTLKRVYAKRQEQTKVYCYTIANKLVKEHDLLVIGDYTPDGNGITTAMRRAMNNRSLIGRFKEALSWVALKSGKIYDEFNEKGTTSSCHRCRHAIVGGLSPDIRHWTCPSCQTTHLRDENAAINGMNKYLRDLNLNRGDFSPPVPSSGLVVQQRWAWRVLPRGVVTIPRGKGCVLSTSAKKLNRTYDNVLPKFAFDQL